MAFIPSVIIGIGGVGKDVLLRIRRMIVENYQSLDNLPSIRFLHVDTDRNPNPEAQIPVEVLGQDIRFRDAEQVDLSENITRQIAQGKETIRRNEHVMEWFDESLPLDRTFREGAGGIRPYGRLAFHYSVNAFRRKLTDAMDQAVRDRSKAETAQSLGVPVHPNQQNIYIVCSLLGGTGSGTFLEVCYNAKAALLPRGLNPYIAGVFVIGGNVDDICQANCYSALKELEYFFTGAQTRRAQPFAAVYPVPEASPINSQEPPVDLCYLVSHLGERGTVFDRDKLEETVAFNLFQEFASAVAEEKRSRRNDIMSLPEFQNLDATLGRTKQFMTFGLSVLEFPAPRVQEMLAHELAEFVANGWLFEEAKGVPNLEREVEDFTRANKLDERDVITSLLTIDGQSLANIVGRNLSEQEGTISRLLATPDRDREIILTTINDHIRANIHTLSFSSDQKECGIHAESIQRNAEFKLKEISEALFEKTNSIIENEHRGPKDALSFLNALLRSLTVKSKAFSEAYRSFESSARRSEENIYKRSQKFRDQIYPTFYRAESEFHSKKLHSEDLKTYMNLSLRRESYRTAYELLSQDTTRNGEFIGSVLSQVRGLISNIEEYRTTLTNLAEAFGDKKRQIGQTLISNPIAEGISLTHTRLREVSARIVPKPSIHVVRMLGRVQDQVGVKDADGRVIKRESILRAVNQRRDDVRNILIQECNETCSGVRKISIAEEMSKAPHLARILEQASQQAGAMLQIAGLRPGSDEGKVTEWMASAIPEQDPKLGELLQEINKIHAYGGGRYSRHLATLRDPYQIIFAEERGIFPLRCIAHLKEYQRAYKRKQPRGTHKQIEFPDLFPEPREIAQIRERAEQAFLLGRLFGFLKQEQDPQTEYSFIYLSYFDVRGRSDRHMKLCSDWGEVVGVLAMEQIDKEVEKKIGGATALEVLEGLMKQKLESAQTKTDRERVWLELQNYLHELEESLRGGTKHPEYQRQLTIIQRFREQYHLTPPEESAQKPPTRPQALENKEEKREQAFRTYVQEKQGRMSEESLLSWGVRFMGLKRARALQILQEGAPQGAGDLETRLDEYKKVFERVISDREIEEQERALLLQKQQELGLSEQDVREIERHFTIAQYRELFQMAVEDGVLTTDERERLRELQALLHLSHDQVGEIEADFEFKEE